MIRLLKLLIILSALMLSPYKAQAEEALERYTQVKLIPERTALKPGDEITIGVEIKLAPHWHVYWKNPGDSGLPVKIEWKAPDNFTVNAIEWPTPDKISYDILVNYGYYDQVILLQPLKIPPKIPEGKFTLTTTIDMLVCNDICIPETSTISIDLNDPETLNTDNTEYIQAAKKNIPKAINGQFEYTENNKIFILSLTPEDRTILSGATEENLEFFPTDWGVINHVAIPKVKIENGTVTIAHKRGNQPLSEIPDLSGLLVIKGKQGQNKGFSLSALPKEAAKPPTVAVNKSNSPPAQDQNKNAQITNKTTWLSAIYLALFGGLILNLMPCVFPVLSIKTLSLVKMNEKENRLARLHGIAYTLGIILSFLIIGGILLILKQAGTAVGWGFQLQSPIIVGLLAYLLFLIGLNLIGFFEFSASLGGVGNKLTQGKSVNSSFFTGTLATIVATPCTAPFMGTAMGFAMTQTPLVGMSVFASLGLGLALPYLVLSYIPPLRKSLPRPGPWMETFKQFLAFPIFASTIWLIWVLSQQSGSYGVLLVLLGMLSIAFCVWLSHLKSNGLARLLTTTLFILCTLLPFLSLFYIKDTSEAVESAQKTYKFGSAFSQEKLSELLKGDDPVFVEMTAAWCITCKLNHAIALNTDTTKSIFKENNVHYLIGDWTNHNDAITQYLDAFNRNGVPLYVFYDKRNPQTKQRPEALILPQVLTSSTIKEILGK